MFSTKIRNIVWCLLGALCLCAAAPAPADAADTELLRLVNIHNTLPPDFVPSGMVKHQRYTLHPAALAAFTHMLSDMKTDGIHDLRLQSAYRPHAHQAAIFKQRVSELEQQGHAHAAAYKLAAQSVQPPGASEHQTGLALDVSTTGTLEQSFAATPAGLWLAAHAHRYGFIIRYPQNKTHLTGIIYEPWHLRYVGAPHAAIMHENNLALEEYGPFMARSGPYLHWDSPPGPQPRAYYLVEAIPLLPNTHLPPDTVLTPCGPWYILTSQRIYPAG